MKGCLIVVVAIAWSVLASLTVHAQERIDYDAITAGGFGDVADVLKDMTPEQRQGVLHKAKEVQKELEAMTPEERGALMQQLHGVSNSLDYKAVKVQKLDPKKSKGLKGIRGDMREYKKRYKK